MKNLEELDFNFCLYVLKKYAIAVIVAIVVSGGLMMAYSAWKKSADDSRKVISYSTSFRLKLAYENMKRNFGTSSKSGSGTLELILKDPEKTGQIEIVEAMGLIALHGFKSAVEEEFFKRTGKRIVLDNKIINIFNKSVFVSVSVKVGKLKQKEAFTVAKIVGDLGVPYLKKQKNLENVVLVEYAVPVMNNNSSNKVSIICIVCGLFVLLLGFLIEIFRDPVLGVKNLERLTGKQVLANWKDPMCRTACGSWICRQFSGGGVLSLICCSGVSDDAAALESALVKCGKRVGILLFPGSKTCTADGMRTVVLEDMKQYHAKLAEMQKEFDYVLAVLPVDKVYEDLPLLVADSSVLLRVGLKKTRIAELEKIMGVFMLTNTEIAGFITE